MSNKLGGIKHDSDKPRVELVPAHGILAAARAFTFGAKKYSPFNWMKGMEWLRLYAATHRHLLEFMMGVTKDKESGLHPLDHALASLMMLQSHVELGLGKDDRPHVKSELQEASEKYPEMRWQWFVKGGPSDEEFSRGNQFVSEYFARSAAPLFCTDGTFSQIRFNNDEYELRQVPRNDTWKIQKANGK